MALATHRNFSVETSKSCGEKSRQHFRQNICANRMHISMNNVGSKIFRFLDFIQLQLEQTITLVIILKPSIENTFHRMKRSSMICAEISEDSEVNTSEIVIYYAVSNFSLQKKPYSDRERKDVDDEIFETQCSYSRSL